MLQQQKTIFCFLCLFPALILGGCAAGCAAGWTQGLTVPNKCFKFVKDFQPYLSAMRICQSFHDNATLLVIHSAFENSEYSTDSQANYNSYWIGLNCISNPYKYTWIDGSPITYSDWQIGNPSNLPNWYCAYLNTYSTNWWTWDCTVGQMYACQYYWY
uniref:C-type lectin domain-containing protein n=1 Tax=Panagrolaimus sp. PS1159 TaxID=55785 RepID=A0AC35FHG9_9BILA